MNLLFNKIILHHSKTKDGKVVNAEAIRRYHVETNGWSDIGYHFLIEQIGDRVAVVPGRPLTLYGAHCSGNNTGSIGVCVVGDYDTDRISLDKELLLTDLCVSLCLMFGIRGREVYGDRDFHSAKTCPGNLFPLGRIKANVPRMLDSYKGIRHLLSKEIVKGVGK